MDYCDSPGNFYSLSSLPRHVAISAFSEMIQGWKGALLVTLVVRSDSNRLEGLSTRDGMSRAVRRRRHQRSAKSGNIHNRLLHDVLYQMCLLRSLGILGAFVATVEVADTASMHFLESPMDLFHIHALAEVSAYAASRVRDCADFLQARLGHLGTVHVERAGTHALSAMQLLDYITKGDKLADSLMRGAFPRAASRFLYRGPRMPWCNPATEIRAASWNFSYSLVKSWYAPFLVGNAVA